MSLDILKMRAFSSSLILYGFLGIPQVELPRPRMLQLALNSVMSQHMWSGSLMAIVPVLYSSVLTMLWPSVVKTLITGILPSTTSSTGGFGAGGTSGDAGSFSQDAAIKSIMALIIYSLNSGFKLNKIKATAKFIKLYDKLQLVKAFGKV